MLKNLGTKAAITYCTGMRKLVEWTMVECGDYMTDERYLRCKDAYDVLSEVLNELNGIEIEEAA